MTEKEYRECIAEALSPEYEAMLSVEAPEHVFSEKFTKNMTKLIRRRRKPYYRFINTAGKRAAVIVTAFITLSLTTVMSVEALRTPFLDFIMSIFSSHSEVRSLDDGKDHPDKIESRYEIKSDLSDYKIDIMLENDESRTICYRYNGYEISFTQSIVKGYDVNYNTEDAVIESVDINGHEAIGFEDNNQYYHLIWNNGEYIIALSSNHGKDALIEIAKSVQKVE